MVWIQWGVRGYATGCFLGCVGAHALTLSGQPIEHLAPLFWACFASVVGSSWVFLPGVKTWKSPAIVLALLVGLGIAYTTVYWWVMRAVSGGPMEMGVPAGELGDRHLINHGKWVRNLTEEEYNLEVLTQSRQWTACYSVFALFALLVSTLKGISPPTREPAAAPEPTSENTR